jgi:hypothetical protein
MGLFGPDPVVDPALLAKLVNEGKRAKATLAKEQTAILSWLRADETVLCVGVDSGSQGTAVATSQRVLQFKGGRLVAEIQSDHITFAGQDRFNGGFLAVINDGAIALQLPREREANAFIQPVQKLLIYPQSRDIPVLYPDYYVNILRGAGKPLTSHNMDQIILSVRMFVGGNATGYFQQLNDLAAKREFEARFVRDSQDQTAHDPDEMIDFLWNWNYRCRRSLSHQIADLGKELVGPRSFLHKCGDEITPWE